MDNPTHADAFLNLISSCFPCRPTAPALPPSPRLGALLRDPESDDAMSLHSTYRPHTRQKKKKPAMQLCGVNLFGKPRGQIRLEDDDDEPPISRPRPRYDSDAAPLPDSTIQNLSISGRSPTTEQPTRHESPEEELARLRAEKAARKARKRERKLKRQLALEQTGDFEGFIGSGSGGGFPISPPSTTTSTPGIEDLLEGSDRGSMRLVDDADPEDADADMGAAVYTRSTRSRSESGSSATRSSRAREEGLVPGNALGLGLRGPPSPLVQEYIPEARDESEVQARSEPITESAPIIIEPQPKSEPIAESKPSPQITESKPTPRPRPKIHISDMPLSSPGAGPGPRTLENSPRLASKREELETPKQDSYGFPSPRLSIPRPSPGIPTSPGPGLPSPRLGLPSPGGFPSMGLTRKGSFGGLGKSYGSGTGLGLNSNSAGAGTGGSQSSFNASGNRSPLGGSKSPLAGRDGDVLDAGGDGRRSGDAGSQRSGGSGDGSGVDGGGQGGSGAAQRLGSGRVTAGMGVALANRGGE